MPFVKDNSSFNKGETKDQWLEMDDTGKIKGKFSKHLGEVRGKDAPLHLPPEDRVNTMDTAEALQQELYGKVRTKGEYVSTSEFKRSWFE